MATYSIYYILRCFGYPASFYLFIYFFFVSKYCVFAVIVTVILCGGVSIIRGFFTVATEAKLTQLSAFNLFYKKNKRTFCIYKYLKVGCER